MPYLELEEQKQHFVDYLRDPSLPCTHIVWKDNGWYRGNGSYYYISNGAQSVLRMKLYDNGFLKSEVKSDPKLKRYLRDYNILATLDDDRYNFILGYLVL